MHVEHPGGYEVDEKLAVAARAPRRLLQSFCNPMDACRGADLVTTDVWTSMGYEAENEARKRPPCRLVRGRRDDGRQGGTPCSCTACPRTAARRSWLTSSTAPIRRLGRGRIDVQKALMEYLLLGRVA